MPIEYSQDYTIKIPMSFQCTTLTSLLLGSIAHAQHSVGKMSVIAKCAVSSQKLLIVPRLQKLLEEIVPVQTFMEEFRKPQKDKNISYNEMTTVP